MSVGSGNGGARQRVFRFDGPPEHSCFPIHVLGTGALEQEASDCMYEYPPRRSRKLLEHVTLTPYKLFAYASGVFPTIRLNVLSR